MLRALKRQEAAQETLEDEDELAPLQKSKTAPTVAPSETSNMDGLGIKRAFTGSTLVEQPSNLSPESTPSMSSEDATEAATTSPATSTHKSHWVPKPTGKARKDSNMSVERGPKAYPPTPMPSDDMGHDVFKNPPRSRRLKSLGAESTVTDLGRPRDVDEVVADAMKTLSIIRQKEQSARPLRIVRQDPQHQADEALRRRFQQLVDDELKLRRLNARNWLRVATWWLLKVRNTHFPWDS